jgi:hypothetical protein
LSVAAKLLLILCLVSCPAAAFAAQWLEYFEAPDRPSRQLFNVLSLSLAGTAMETQVGRESPEPLQFGVATVQPKRHAAQLQ